MTQSQRQYLENIRTLLQKVLSLILLELLWMILSTTVCLVIYTKFLLQHFLKGNARNLKMHQARHLKTKTNGFISLTGIKTDVVDWTTVVSFFGKLNQIFVLSTRQNYKLSLCLVLYIYYGNVIRL